MALTKVRDGGTNFTNIASMTKLLDATISSAVSSYDIDSTHINSTYDTYHLVANLHPASDGEDLEGRWIVGGSVDTGSNYHFEGLSPHGTSGFTSDGTSSLRFNRYGIGNATGEGISLYGRITNVNSTVFACSIEGQVVMFGTSSPFMNNFGTGHKDSNASDVVNGLSIFFSSGNIEFGNIQLYGIS
tara:strand:+ start:72 stop:632 length:561 start_codon:yes stop_codon:yes gene_type:complete